jgi:hypothetical protein
MLKILSGDTIYGKLHNLGSIYELSIWSIRYAFKI